MKVASIAVAACALALGVSGCAKQSTTAQPAPSGQGPDATENGHHERDQAAPGSMLHWLFRFSLAEVNLRPDQRTALEAVHKDNKGKSEPMREARRQLSAMLADGVAAGSIDRAKVDPQTEKLVQSVQAMVPVWQDSMNKLHATLDPAQRKQLIETMRTKGERWKDHAQMHAAQHGGPGAMMKQRFQHFAKELQLTQDQMHAIRDKMQAKMGSSEQKEAHRKRAEEMREHMKAVGDAFMTDKFDAKALDVGKNAADMTRLGTKGIIDFIDTVQTVLTPEQRARFAQIIRERGHAPEGDPHDE